MSKSGGVTLNVVMAPNEIGALKKRWGGVEFNFVINRRSGKSMRRQSIPCRLNGPKVVVKLQTGDGLSYQDIHRLLKQEFKK